MELTLKIILYFFTNKKKVSGEMPIAIFLFKLVSQLAEGNRKHFPVKKLLLLLWKVLLMSLGGRERQKEIKNFARAQAGLPIIHKGKEMIPIKQTYEFQCCIFFPRFFNYLQLSLFFLFLLSFIHRCIYQS